MPPYFTFSQVLFVYYVLNKENDDCYVLGGALFAFRGQSLDKTYHYSIAALGQIYFSFVLPHVFQDISCFFASSMLNSY